MIAFLEITVLLTLLILIYIYIGYPMLFDDEEKGRVFAE